MVMCVCVVVSLQCQIVHSPNSSVNSVSLLHLLYFKFSWNCRFEFTIFVDATGIQRILETSMWCKQVLVVSYRFFIGFPLQNIYLG